MIILKSLTLSNIGRFVDTQCINFPNTQLIQIDGKNNNTGGSSGSGKSTIFEALMYLFNISDRSSTQLQSRLSKNKMLISGTFIKNNKEIIINRGPGVLSVSIDGQECKGLNKIVEEKIDELIGIPRYILKKIIYKQQNSGGFFLQMTPKESYQFIMDVLGMDKWTNKLEKLSETEGDINSRISNIFTDISKIMQVKSNYESMLSQKIEPEKPASEDELNISKEKILRLKNIINNQTNQMQIEIDKIPIPNKEEPKTDAYKQELIKINGAIDTYKKKINEGNLAISNKKDVLFQELEAAKDKAKELLAAKDNMSALKDEVVKIQTELRHIQMDKCPTCLQSWKELDSTRKKEDLNRQLKKAQHDLSECKRIVATETMIVSKLRDINQNYENAKAVCLDPTLMDKLDSYTERRETIKNKIDNIVTQVENKYLLEKDCYNDMINEIKDKYQEELSTNQELLDKLINKTRDLESNIKNYKILKQSYDSDVKTLNTNIINEKNKIADLTKENKVLSEEVYLIQESKRLVKEYTMQVFQDMLETVASLSNQKLSKVPNMQQSSIYFDVNKETKAGKIRQEITPVVNIGEDLNIPVKTLSGGERAVIDLCVDLSVIEVIEQYTNAGMDFYIMDEPFTSMDTISKVEFLNVLESIDSDKKIIIVSHDTELKAIVNDIIIVERTDTISKII